MNDGNRETRKLLEDALKETGGSPDDVTCTFFFPAEIPGATSMMQTRALANLPEGDLYPCVAFSEDYLYNQVLTADKRAYRIDITPKLKPQH